MAKPVQVYADFTAESGITNDPQPPTVNEIVSVFAADIIEYISAQQREINDLKAELNK